MKRPFALPSAFVAVVEIRSAAEREALRFARIVLDGRAHATRVLPSGWKWGSLLEKQRYVCTYERQDNGKGSPLAVFFSPILGSQGTSSRRTPPSTTGRLAVHFLVLERWQELVEA